MPRVYQRKAGKDYPQHGIKKGDTYFAWSFYREPERKSKTRPLPSQLTNVESEALMLEVYELDEFRNPEEVRSAISSLEDAAEMEQEKADNISEHFPDSEAAQRAEAHVDALEGAISELESIADDWEDYNSTLGEDGEPTEETIDHSHHERDWDSDVKDTQPDWE